ncbi:MAG TPA: cyanophycinase [Thermomicrobiales bacterium]|nr:cyanophycinase [Thermomicrobiales bacterium]
MAQSSRGPLLAIGGAEDKFRDRAILRRFTELAGGDDARIAIIPTASVIDDAGQRYKAIFLELGATSAEVLYVGRREDANTDELVELVEHSTGIFITGGNQIRVASILGGTRVGNAVIRCHRAGVPVGGTSAGASVMSTVMVAGGRSGATPRTHTAQMSPGLGLIDNVIIDQHFRERDRVGRLVTMVSHNPGLLGLGIDEDTAALIWPHGTLDVIGRGSVLIVDGAEMRSDIHSARGKRPLTIANVIMHFVADGGKFDLDGRKVLCMK